MIFPVAVTQIARPAACVLIFTELLIVVGAWILAIMPVIVSVAKRAGALSVSFVRTPHGVLIVALDFAVRMITAMIVWIIVVNGVAVPQ